MSSKKRDTVFDRQVLQDQLTERLTERLRTFDTNEYTLMTIDSFDGCYERPEEAPYASIEVEGLPIDVEGLPETTADISHEIEFLETQWIDGSFKRTGRSVEIEGGIHAGSIQFGDEYVNPQEEDSYLGYVEDERMSEAIVDQAYQNQTPERFQEIVDWAWANSFGDGDISIIETNDDLEAAKEQGLVELERDPRDMDYRTP